MGIPEDQLTAECVYTGRSTDPKVCLPVEYPNILLAELSFVLPQCKRVNVMNRSVRECCPESDQLTEK
ncbi:hypothetical protein DPMN_093690 [Dreissena polymorpha]|uniref:Uncharacterized protein n=1 Tax=Dreissena polymorpha TaxID=45954 RepID=A0A9D4L407_DREPO|nr:hypothetical protein DPMN_093690 [Dreissena polymorpha]